MPQDKQYYHLIPQAVYRQIGLLETNHFRKIPGYRREWMLQIISTIANSTRRNDEPAPIHSGIIQKIVPHGDKYLLQLVRSGVVDRSGTYTPKVESYKYQFADKYKSDFKTIPVTDIKLINRIKSQTFKPPKGRPARRHEQDIFLPGLEIDADAAFQWIADSIPPGATDHINAYMAAVNRVSMNVATPKTDNTSGRHHTVLTNLPKYLKQFVTLYGEPIVNVDLKNSQPFLATMVLTDPKRLAQFTESKQAFSLFAKVLQPVNGHDVMEYIFHTHSGSIYEYMAEQFAARGSAIDRSGAKDIMFKILYAENGHFKDERRIFSDTFPTVAQQFDRARGYDQSADRYVNYKRFPIILQSIESYLILRLVIPRVRSEHPNIPILSIHDSLTTASAMNPVTVRGYAVAVKNIMEQVIGNWYQIRPTIEIETNPRNISTYDLTEMTMKYRDKRGMCRDDIGGGHVGAV